MSKARSIWPAQTAKSSPKPYSLNSTRSMKTQSLPTSRFNTLALLLAVVLAGMIATGCKKSAQVPDPKPPSVVISKESGSTTNPSVANTNGHTTSLGGGTPPGNSFCSFQSLRTHTLSHQTYRIRLHAHLPVRCV